MIKFFSSSFLVLSSGNSLGYGEVDAFERRRKARSNDFLDRIDPVSLVSTRSATLHTKRKTTPKMSRIEQGLYLGSLEAATDVILLESNAITHIVTVDSVPLPRKITSLMPRIAMLHLQVRATVTLELKLLVIFRVVLNQFDSCQVDRKTNLSLSWSATCT